MKHLASALALCLAASAAHAQVSTAFTYQGQALLSGSPINGLIDVRFSLYDAALGGTQVATRLCADNVQAIDGRFTTLLDFGDEYSRNPNLFLEIELRTDTGTNCSTSAGFTILGPRQQLTASPYAVFASSASIAENANSLGGIPASTYRSASNLITGTLADARLSTNIPRLNAANIFSGAVTFSNPASNFAGSGSALVGLNATNITTGLLSPAQGGTGANTSGAAAGSVLKFTSGSWQPGVDQDTTYTAADGLSLTGTTFSVAPQGITSAMLGTNSVTTFAIAPDAIIASDISNLAVTTAKIANDAVTAVKIADGAVSGGIGGQIVDGSIGNADLQASMVASINIIDGTIAGIDIAPGGIAGGTQGPIADNTVASIDILDGTVTSADIAADTIQAVDIAPDAVNASEIAASAVGAGELASNAGSLARVSAGLMQTDGVRVGIGGAPTTAKVFVEGNIEATTGLSSQGSIVAADYTYLNPFPRIYSVGVYDFVREDNGINFGENNGSGRTGDPILFNTSLFVTVTAGAPVHLPDGATVTGFEVYAEDNNLSNMTVQLLRRSFTEAPGGTLASILTSGEVAGIRQFSDFTISGGTISNATNQYIVRLEIPGGSGPLNFKGAVIRYTVPRPLP